MSYNLIDLLSSNKFIEKDRITDNDGFDYRLRLQKAVFLLHYLHIPPFVDYRFNMYIKGPYSPDLAADYFSDNPLKFNADNNIIGKLKWFMGHDDRWLEVAASILYILERYVSIRPGEILDIVHVSKPWVDEKMFNDIYSELGREGLFVVKTESISH
ncbi:MAG: hypothetical protein ACP5U0_10350 [Caldisphaera sp.]